MSSFVLIILLLIASIEGGFAQNLTFEGQADLVVDLPGQPPAPKFNQYAGYVTISEGRALFYWFHEAMEDPMKKPLVLWLNGGPACSSVAGGALKEIGPFLVTKNGTNLRFNPYAWNKVANIIFLESPAGVGFSYINTLDSVEFTDASTAEDSYTFLNNWFSKFPMFRSHAFYIAGESYGGHYITQLAELIHEKNKLAKDNFINLKALLIGNPLLDWVTHFLSRAKFSWNNGIISSNLYQTVVKECDTNPKDRNTNYWNEECQKATDAVKEAFKNIELSHIYIGRCSNSSSKTVKPDLEDPLIAHDPCVPAFIMEVYLNQPDVQKALHANVTKYSTCSKPVRAKYKTMVVPTVVPIVRKLLDVGYPIWIYSGDVDANAVMDATRSCILSMQLTEKAWDKWGGWRKWHHEGQVGGWMVEYVEGLTFITVRGAGHMVPAYAPSRALLIFSQFLKGEDLPFEGVNKNA